jgi:excisionase family DNA binding protein
MTNPITLASNDAGYGTDPIAPASNEGEGAATADTHKFGRSVSIDQAAQLLAVSRRTIYNRIRDGRLRTVRTLGGSQRVLVDSLCEQGFRPQAFSATAAAASFSVRPPRG